MPISGVEKEEIGMHHRDTARLYEIAALERPLTDVERLQIGLDARIDPRHVAYVLELAAFERPLGESELIELDFAFAA